MKLSFNNKSRLSRISRHQLTQHFQGMNAMKTFDANDCYIEQRCTEAEIGTSWEPRWGVSDLREGACKPNMVGLPMPMQIDIDTPDADQLKDIPQEFVYEYELADYHRDRAAYRAKGGNVLALIKIGEERKLRQSSEQATLAKLSATRLRGMDDQDILLAFVNGILAEADDVRERIMARMDIDLAGLKEMVEEGEADHV
jgi:hypothetical protein